MAALAPAAADIGHALATDLMRDVVLGTGVSCATFAVLYEGSDGNWAIADNDTDLSGKTANQIGIALHKGYSGKRVQVLTDGVLLVGTGVVTHGMTYVLGETGAINPIGDLATADKKVYIATGVDFDTDPQYGADALYVKIIPTAIAVP